MDIPLDQSAAARADTSTGSGPRVRVWDLPTRIFHWSLALSFAGAWLTSESERLRDLHAMLGYTIAGLIAFRLLWGVAGTRYARFASFLFGPAAVGAYLRSLLTRRPQHWLGHNPAGAIAIFLLLGLAAFTVLSGHLTLNESGGEWLEEVHEIVANGLLAVVVIHLIGVLVSSLLHRENLARAMVDGFKVRGATTEARDVPRRTVVGALLLVAVIGFWGAWQTGWVSLGDAAVTQSQGDDDD